MNSLIFRLAVLTLLWLICSALEIGAGAALSRPDPRNFSNGQLIPDEDYCDQPRMVVTQDGTWVCIMTTGPAHEGSEGQHVVATTSKDRGKTWSSLVDIEPAEGKRIASYALALKTPSDRIYAFYCYNGDGISTLPGGQPIRHDMQGWFCFRYSDDQGKTWSQRYRLPMRVTAVDRNNDWQGKLQMFWAIGTPATFDHAAIFGFAKLGKYLLQDGEGWFFASNNLLAEQDPDKIEWQMLPDGDHGVRAPELGTVQEEHDVVHLEGDDLFCVYRTALGYAACSYSRDGGHTWEKPRPLAYTPGGRVIKQPRACTKIWKAKNGHYLLWFHNNGTTTYNNGLNAGSRNIAWLSGGMLREGRLRWSQPEIVAYVDGGLEGCSYPDLIEDAGKFYLCATQKREARVMELDAELLDRLWRQESIRQVASEGLLVNLSGSACAAGAAVPAPKFAPLSGEIQGRTLPRGAQIGITIDVALRLADLSPGQVILDGRDRSGKGFALKTTDRETIRFEMSDGWTGAYWDTDAGLFRTNVDHQVTVIVDGGPKAIVFVVDGQVCDGAGDRLFGFGRFSPNFKELNGAAKLLIAPNLHGELAHLRVYHRALRVTEAVGNYRAY